MDMAALVTIDDEDGLDRSFGGFRVPRCVYIPVGLCVALLGSESCNLAGDVECLFVEFKGHKLYTA
jgi:hypothetical protein